MDDLNKIIKSDLLEFFYQMSSRDKYAVFSFEDSSGVYAKLNNGNRFNIIFVNDVKEENIEEPVLYFKRESEGLFTFLNTKDSSINKPIEVKIREVVMMNKIEYAKYVVGKCDELFYKGCAFKIPQKSITEKLSTFFFQENNNQITNGKFESHTMESMYYLLKSNENIELKINNHKFNISKKDGSYFYVEYEENLVHSDELIEKGININIRQHFSFKREEENIFLINDFSDLSDTDQDDSATNISKKKKTNTIIKIWKNLEKLISSNEIKVYGGKFNHKTLEDKVINGCDNNEEDEKVFILNFPCIN